MKLSQRIEGIQPSPTLAVTAKAKQLIREGGRLQFCSRGA